jgi:GNAT superfamily N-acetyltransferase
MSVTQSYRIRRATMDDIAIIAYQRAAMLQDAGMADAPTANIIQINSIAPLTEMFSKGEYLGWLVEIDGKIVGGGGIILRRLLPRPGSLHGSHEAYILNVYIEPEHRHRGVARLLMLAMIGWCREQEIPRVALHASDAGEPLYKSLGFARTTEMVLQE